jgi:hypothetical protein
MGNFEKFAISYHNNAVFTISDFDMAQRALLPVLVWGRAKWIPVAICVHRLVRFVARAVNGFSGQWCLG